MLSLPKPPSIASGPVSPVRTSSPPSPRISSRPPRPLMTSACSVPLSRSAAPVPTIVSANAVAAKASTPRMDRSRSGRRRMGTTVIALPPVQGKLLAGMSQRASPGSARSRPTFARGPAASAPDRGDERGQRVRVRAELIELDPLDGGVQASAGGPQTTVGTPAASHIADSIQYGAPARPLERQQLDEPVDAAGASESSQGSRATSSRHSASSPRSLDDRLDLAQAGVAAARPGRCGARRSPTARAARVNGAEPPLDDGRHQRAVAGVRVRVAGCELAVARLDRPQQPPEAA